MSKSINMVDDILECAWFHLYIETRGSVDVASLKGYSGSYYQCEDISHCDVLFWFASAHFFLLDSKHLAASHSCQASWSSILLWSESQYSWYSRHVPSNTAVLGTGEKTGGIPKRQYLEGV